MSQRRTRQLRLILVAAALTAAAASASRLASPAPWLPPALPTPEVEASPLPTPETPWCRHDPVNLPPPPPGPDGQAANYLHTCGNRLYDAHGREVKITGVSWSGMEHSDFVPGGLGSRNWQEILDQVVALGYNTIRVPFSSETLELSRPVGGVNFALNPDLQGLTGLEMLDRLVEGARERGLKVILDRHHPTSGNRTDLWYTAQVPEDRWVDDWRLLAARYLGNDTVIAMDLHNEPHGPATWGSGDPATDWRLAAERAGNAVLDVNPYVLIFVEGIEHYGDQSYWWGGNLLGVRTAPVRLQVPHRIVYTPHDYGPTVSGQPWFWDPRFPANLPEVWDHFWGYIHHEEIAPVIVGEFGGRSFGDDPDGRWQQALLDYLRRYDLGFVVWSLNPSWDTGGIFMGDWKGIDQPKQAAYAALLGAPLGPGDGALLGQTPARLKVLFRQNQTSAPGGDVAFTFRIINDGPAALDLSRLELRYWLAPDAANLRDQAITVEAGAAPQTSARADVVPPDGAGVAGYLRVRFASGSGEVAPYRASQDLTIRFHRRVSAALAGVADYSFFSRPVGRDELVEWERVTLYLDGQLAWGDEPPAVASVTGP